MWFFHSSKIVFGEDALAHLNELTGQRAFIVTDPNIVRMGLARQVQERLRAAGIESTICAEVEPDPSLQTAQQCAAAMTEYEPDWVIGLGGGSSIDAAKAAWLLYECPDADPAAINPLEDFGLRAKARLIAIPTTSGTGAEVTLATTLTDTVEQRKLGLGSFELVPDIAIVDPNLVLGLPPQITASTGLDALTHAIEGYTSVNRNDFSDGLCLKAVQLIFDYLPRAWADGSDTEAREHMHNAATIAGLGFGNSMAALAHAMGHALGAVFHTPHGSAVSVCLPYTIQFNANAGRGRYADIASVLRLPAKDESEGTASLVAAIFDLMKTLDQPATIHGLKITPDVFDQALPHLVLNAECDTSVVMGTRVPDGDELERLLRYAYEGRPVDF
jgi:alcohol dehydrogenase class IV